MRTAAEGSSGRLWAALGGSALHPHLHYSRMRFSRCRIPSAPWSVSAFVSACSHASAEVVSLPALRIRADIETENSFLSRDRIAMVKKKKKELSLKRHSVIIASNKTRLRLLHHRKQPDNRLIHCFCKLILRLKYQTNIFWTSKSEISWHFSNF